MFLTATPNKGKCEKLLTPKQRRRISNGLFFLHSEPGANHLNIRAKVVPQCVRLVDFLSTKELI